MVLARAMKERMNFHTSYSEKEKPASSSLFFVFTPWVICLLHFSPLIKQFSLFEYSRLPIEINWLVFFSLGFLVVIYHTFPTSRLLTSIWSTTNISVKTSYPPYHPLAITPKLQNSSLIVNPTHSCRLVFTHILQWSILFQLNLGLLSVC